MRQTVLVTGGSRGIGRAAVEKFARRGDRVILNYLQSQKEAEQLASRLNAEGFEVFPARADVSDSLQVRGMVAAGEERFGGIDVFVSNAGRALTGLLTDVTDEEWRALMGVTVDAAFYGCRAVLPGMIRRHRGRVVLVSSIWGITGASCEAAYSAAKAALIGLAKALAKEVGPSGVTVNCVAPGVMDTDMNAGLSLEERRVLCEETPLGRFGTPEEAADAIAFLASEKASFITGQVLSPNGGFVI